MISKRHAATGLIHYSEVHIARSGDLFIERYKNYSQNHQLSRPTNY